MITNLTKEKLDSFQAVLEDIGSCINKLSGDNTVFLDTKYKSIVTDISSARSTIIDVIL